MVRFGLIGGGKIFPTHADALKAIPGATLAAVYDNDPGAASEAAAAAGVRAVASLEDLWSLVDAVCVLTPSGLHAEVGHAAIRAGKHVVLEKPIDVGLEAAAGVVRAGREAGVKLTVISQHRFANPIRRLREAVQGGALGRVLQGDAIIKWYRTQAYYDQGDWRGTWALDGGGCLMNQGVHYVDMLQWVMGGVQSVQAMTRTLNHRIEVEDTAMAMVEFRNGAVGLIQGSTCCYPGLAERLEVHGSHGSVILEGDKVKLWKIDPEGAADGLYGGGVMQQPTPSLHALAEEAETDASCSWGEQHRLQLADFAEAIREDRDPFITGEAALEPLKVILAIYRSAREGGRRVELSELA